MLYAWLINCASVAQILGKLIMIEEKLYDQESCSLV